MAESTGGMDGGGAASDGDGGTGGGVGGEAGGPTKAKVPAAKAAAETSETPSDEKERDSSGRFRAKLKVDGAEEDVDLSPEEVTARLQKQRHYEKRQKQFQQEMVQLEQQKRALQEFVSRPEAYLEELLGAERLDAIVQARLAAAARAAALTPEQAELERVKAETKRLQEALAQREEMETQGRREAAEMRLVEQAQPQIVAALEAVNLPRSPAVLQRFLQLGLDAVNSGYQPDMPAIAKQLAEEWDAAARFYRDQVIAAQSPEKLFQWIGEKNFKLMNDWQMARVKGGQAPRKAAVQNGAAHRVDEAPEIIDEAEFRRRAGLR